MDDPECEQLQQCKESETPQLAGRLEHGARGHVEAEHDEERDDDNVDERVSIGRGKRLGVFLFLQFHLEGVDLFENFFCDGGALRHDFDTARDDTFCGQDFFGGVNLAGFGLFFEIEYVGARECIERFVECTLQPLCGERALQLAERFVDTSLHGLDFANFYGVFVVFLDEGDCLLVVYEVLDALDVVVVAVQRNFCFGLCEERVRDALLHHLVEHGHEGVAGDGVRAERLDGRDGETLF